MSTLKKLKMIIRHEIVFFLKLMSMLRNFILKVLIIHEMGREGELHPLRNKKCFIFTQIKDKNSNQYPKNRQHPPGNGW